MPVKMIDVIVRALLYCRRFGLWRGLRVFWSLHFLLDRQPPGAFLQVQIPGLRTAIHLRPRDSDRDVFEQIYIDQHYELGLNLNATLILDCGANIGISTLYFAARYPEAAILAIEPDSEAFDVLRINTSAYPNVTPVKAALWGCHAPLAIVNPETPSWEHRVDVTEAVPEALLRAVTMHDLLKFSGAARISLLKLDVQGAEKTVFDEGCHPWLERTDVIMLELHDLEVPSCGRTVFRELVKYDFQMRHNAHTVCVDFRAK